MPRRLEISFTVRVAWISNRLSCSIDSFLHMTRHRPGVRHARGRFFSRQHLRRHFRASHKLPCGFSCARCGALHGPDALPCVGAFHARTGRRLWERGVHSEGASAHEGAGAEGERFSVGGILRHHPRASRKVRSPAAGQRAVPVAARTALLTAFPMTSAASVPTAS